jgi:hypothetical protein
VVAACVALIAGSLVFSAHERLVSQTEEIAIAGADTLSGRLPGYPCQTVNELAAAHGFRVESCVPLGLEIRIVVSSELGALRLTSQAHAGPPIQ